jgi:predicted nucleic acid-binding protein
VASQLHKRSSAKRCQLLAEVDPGDLAPALCRDPTELPLLGTAVAAACAQLISVDRDLLDMQKPFRLFVRESIGGALPKSNDSC